MHACFECPSPFLSICITYCEDSLFRINSIVREACTLLLSPNSEHQAEVNTKNITTIPKSLDHLGVQGRALPNRDLAAQAAASREKDPSCKSIILSSNDNFCSILGISVASVLVCYF